jgi:hypothetical protein
MTKHIANKNKQISMFSLLSLGRYLCWWTTGFLYHPPSSQNYNDIMCDWIVRRTNIFQIDFTRSKPTGFVKEQHNGRHQWNRNCLPFRISWVQPQVFLGFALLILLFSVLRFTDSDHPFGIFKLFLLSFDIRRHLYVYLSGL